jgi:predicted nucleic acid-binding protein
LKRRRERVPTKEVIIAAKSASTNWRVVHWDWRRKSVTERRLRMSVFASTCR